MSLSDEHMKALQRMDQGLGGRHSRERLDWYGTDTYAVGTVIAFRSGHKQPWAAVKVDARSWELTGRRWSRTWQQLMRTVGPGYKMSVASSPDGMMP